MDKTDEKLTERVMAYRALHETRYGTPELDMYAFLSLFHPELSHEQKMELARDTKK